MSRLYFGEPWDPFALFNAVPVSTPLGKCCAHCLEEIVEGDQGYLNNVIVCADDDDDGAAALTAVLRPFHKECDLRQSVSMEHLRGECSCHVTGECGSAADQRTARQDALDTWAYVVEHRDPRADRHNGPAEGGATHDH